ncbi:16S rRNA (cytidine(1402)-2'-O)-methyltransferase [Virgibacillus profundi]|uniref:Ribosomal RNA small subunit methyltransferase I n=1 Tax=Virgibacillus profundi TaxID=2024555 RepID=A0A2A2IAY7_9BACI|nr:16S rRNA (cytidine(1402)-2'-O)-methyltransferase [Virgibacillus profundi]PAV28548.1 16S rRNA (cytidine(1402)-2'-O)-methyltransferase [Virgibacillus profundi]PXY52721.1 16S rRNA (cytidine(1402)-2'-O)-methyltransferase [Virgibacillus profundi]
MKIQKSFDDDTKGILYVVPTPIGNLEDITYRALKILKSVTIIAAEDTRNTKKLLNHFEIATPLISYHEHNKLSRVEQLLYRVENGESIAIVSDAGMPAISDPGYELVRAAIDRDQSVVVLPGANAAVCALIGSGLPTDEFYFYGFLPRKKRDKEAEIERLKSMKASLLFYESPYRVKDTLKAMHEKLGSRNIAVARELTKRFEEYVRGTTEELIAWTDEKELKGEFCIIVEGNPSDESEQDTILWWSNLSVLDHVSYYIEEKDFSSKDAIKQVAAERKLPKREVYQIFHVE